MTELVAIARPRLRVRTRWGPPAAAVLAAASSITVLAGSALAFYWVPSEADQGFSQRIFYLHVPIALTSYACFGAGAWKGFRLVQRGELRHDLESYTAVHIGVIFGVLTLVTGSIWARVSWGIWWSWGEDQLVLYLVVFLFYCTYFMLRFSIDAGVRRARVCAVYAMFGAVLVPVSFLAIRLAPRYIHPVVFTTHGAQMARSMLLVFGVMFAGLLGLGASLYRTELAGRRIDHALRTLRSEA
ncbi:MAG TPA: cytochrome c biogenesis protein CcsA [Gaiellaceae bacterium]|nr:cytochrome c biogenesis protein CcsA [Gaiellaceae bacterium]